MTAEDLKSLQYGEKVHKFSDGKLRRFHFVGLMPDCKNYLIFSDGECLTHLHISDNDGTFRDSWYSGEYKSDFVGYLMIDYHQKRIESIRKVYLKEVLDDVDKYNV